RTQRVDAQQSESFGEILILFVAHHAKAVAVKTGVQFIQQCWTEYMNPRYDKIVVAVEVCAPLGYAVTGIVHSTVKPRTGTVIGPSEWIRIIQPALVPPISCEH